MTEKPSSTHGLRTVQCALALSVIGVVVLLTIPMYSTESGSVAGRPGGAIFHSFATHSDTLVGVNGWGAVRALLIPVLLACIALLFERTPGRRVARLLAAVLMVVFCVITILSVGIFFLPAAIALVAGAAMAPTDTVLVASPSRNTM